MTSPNQAGAVSEVSKADERYGLTAEEFRRFQEHRQQLDNALQSLVDGYQEAERLRDADYAIRINALAE